MNKSIYYLKSKFNNNKQLLFLCFVSTLVLGLITHAYMFFQDSFSHDSLNEFNGEIYGNEWKVQLGRFAVPFYRLITRGDLSLPWLIGVISLCWIALAVFFTVKVFNIKSTPLIVIIVGLFSTNIAVISTTATYIHDLDSNMFSLFLSVVAVYLWKNYKLGFIFAVPFIALSLALYQSFISVTIVLVIIYLVVILLNGEKFKTVFVKGVKAICSLVAGGMVYFCTFKAVLAITGITEEQDSYNSITQMKTDSLIDFLKTMIYVFKTTVVSFFFPKNALSKNLVALLIVLTFATVIFFVLFKIFKKEIGFAEKVLTIILICVMPVGMSVSGILMGDQGHDLMRFSEWLIFLFALLVVSDVKRSDSKKKATLKSISCLLGKAICYITVVAIIWGNIVSANEIYLKKDLEQDSALSFFTRVVDKMDNFEEFDRKTMPVVFIGRPDYYEENKIGFNNGYGIMGATGNYALGAAGPSWYDRYFEYKLHYDIIAIDNKDLDEYKKNAEVLSMPVFPTDGCMRVIDNVLVVKLGEVNG